MTAAAATYSPGLEGVIAGESAICTITDEGLSYRGYRIADLAQNARYEEVAYLLLHGDLPNQQQLNAFIEELSANSSLPPALLDMLRQVPPSAAPMDVLRSGVSLLAHWDPEAGDNSHEANVRKATRLLAQVPSLIGARHRLGRGLAPLGSSPYRSHAANLLYQILGTEPGRIEAEVFDTSLILYAEHEYNASAFGARVVVSTLSDLHSGIVAGIGALKGPLHGGANEKAMEMLLSIGGPENAEAWVRGRLERRERIMGFGHRVVRKGDTRVPILKAAGEQLVQARGDDYWLRMANTIQEIVESEKGLLPNVDFPCAWVYYMLGLPVELYTPLFVASRVAGWAAHIIEQLDNNRLIRPRGLYVGSEPRTVTPIGERG